MEHKVWHLYRNDLARQALAKRRKLVDLGLFLEIQLLHSFSRLPAIHHWHVYVAYDQFNWLQISHIRFELVWLDLVKDSDESIDQGLSIDEHFQSDVLSVESIILQLHRLVADLEVVREEDQLLVGYLASFEVFSALIALGLFPFFLFYRLRFTFFW